MSVVKINALSVPAGAGASLEQRFAARAGLVESTPGFERFELLRPVEGTDRYLVYTRWRSEEDFQAWSEGNAQRAHGRPGGEQQRPAASGAELWSFEVAQASDPVGEQVDG